MVLAKMYIIWRSVMLEAIKIRRSIRTYINKKVEEKKK